jgi:hypothetical protein
MILGIRYLITMIDESWFSVVFKTAAGRIAVEHKNEIAIGEPRNENFYKSIITCRCWCFAGRWFNTLLHQR